MISKDLLQYVSDADLSTKMNSVEHSTNIREVVSVGYMVENYHEEMKE